MNDFMRNIVVAGLGSMAYYIFYESSHRSTSAIQVEILVKTFGFGCLAGLVLTAISELGGKGKTVPILSSWIALAACIFMVEPLMVTRDLFWHSFFRGYVAYLIWQGYRGKLQKI